MHRPATFQDMLQLAERADQAFMADRNGALQGIRGNFERNNFSKNNMSNNQQRGGRNSQVTWQNVSQYGDSRYKGPAPMVLGNVGDAPVCYYCNKPGHIRKDCFKFRNDLAGGRGAGNSGRGGGGRSGRHGGRHSGGRSLNVMQEQQDVHEVMRLGMAALANKEKQQQAVSGGKNVSFADNVGESKGQYTQSKN